MKHFVTKHFVSETLLNKCFRNKMFLENVSSSAVAPYETLLKGIQASRPFKSQKLVFDLLWIFNLTIFSIALPTPGGWCFLFHFAGFFLTKIMPKLRPNFHRNSEKSPKLKNTEFLPETWIGAFLWNLPILLILLHKHDCYHKNSMISCILDKNLPKLCKFSHIYNYSLLFCLATDLNFLETQQNFHETQHDFSKTQAKFSRNCEIQIFYLIYLV